MNSRTTIIVAILVVMLILVAIEAVSGPFGRLGPTPGPDDEGDNGIGARCAAAHGHVVGHGVKASCVAPDGSVISLP